MYLISGCQKKIGTNRINCEFDEYLGRRIMKIKEIIAEIFFVLFTIMVFVSFVGAIMWIWIGEIGAKIFLTGVLSTMLFGCFGSSVEKKQVSKRRK